jgi:hypothetical protein
MHHEQVLEKCRELKALTERIRTNLAYLIAVRENGKLDEYGSYSLSDADIFEALSSRFEDLHAEVSGVSSMLQSMVFPATSRDVVIMDRSAIAALMDVGFEIKMDFHGSWDVEWYSSVPAFIIAIFNIELPPMPTMRGMKKAAPIRLSF